MDFMNTIIHGDCEEVLKAFPDCSIDLIFTSICVDGAQATQVNTRVSSCTSLY